MSVFENFPLVYGFAMNHAIPIERFTDLSVVLRTFATWLASKVKVVLWISP